MNAVARHLGGLLAHGIHHGLIEPGDAVYTLNRLLEVLRIDAVDPAAAREPFDPAVGVDALLTAILDDAVAAGRLAPDTPAARDRLGAAVMGVLVPRPSTVAAAFHRLLPGDPAAATDGFFAMSAAANYVRAAAVDSGASWSHPSEYGVLLLTINTAKPERDPRDIAAAAEAPATGYPACLLCRENEGYAGRPDHPARQNLRLVPLTLGGQPWFLQYSPYQYYREHCIALSAEHRPMRVDGAAVVRLLDFADLLPHYMIGSNADIPIVGGSILSHDHFQGGRFRFPMQDAVARAHWRHPDGTVAALLRWPLTVLRLETAHRPSAAARAAEIIGAWNEHDEPATGVLARTGGTRHNAVAPIVNRAGAQWQVHLILRNNRASAEHPTGIFHPHAPIHPVKKENIGLIEAMGLAILPPRLQPAVGALTAALLAGRDPADLPDEVVAFTALYARLPTGAAAPTDPAHATALVRSAVAADFTTGLTHCGVLGTDDGAAERADRLLRPLGWRRRG